MCRSIVCRAALLVLLLAPFRVEGQISRRSGVPFVGLRTATVTRDGKVTTDAGTVARRSDGSTYLQMNGLVLIFDMARKLSITLDAKSQTYSVSPDSSLKANPWPADYAQRYMARLGAAGSTREIDGGWVIKTVGRRNIDGVDAALLALTNSDGRTQEQWYSPALDIDLERKERVPATGTESDIRIVQIRMGEPDASLFVIPKGYVQEEKNAIQVGRVDH